MVGGLQEKGQLNCRIHNWGLPTIDEMPSIHGKKVLDPKKKIYRNLRLYKLRFYHHNQYYFYIPKAYTIFFPLCLTAASNHQKDFPLGGRQLCPKTKMQLCLTHLPEVSLGDGLGGHVKERESHLND